MEKNRSVYMPYLITALLAVLVFSVLGWRIADGRRQALESWEGRINSVAERVGDSVEIWLSERRADITLVAGWPSVVALVSDDRAGKQDSDAGTHLSSLLAELMRLYKYVGFYVLASDGRVLAAVPGSESLMPADLETAVQSVSTGRYMIGNIIPGSSGRLHLGFFAPVRLSGDEGSGGSGAVAVLVDPYERLFPIVTDESVPTRTGETLLVKKQGSGLLFISPLRYKEGAPGTFFLTALPDSLAGLLAVGGREIFGELVDYRGEKVLAATRHIQETGWGLVRKVDLSEALASWRATVLRETLASIFLMLLVLALVLWQRNRLEALHYKQLAHSEARRGALAAAVPDLIVLLDSRRRFTWLNDAGLAFFDDAPVGKPVSEFTADKDESDPFEGLRNLFDGSAPSLLLETRLRRRDGEVRLMAWHCCPVAGTGGVEEVLCVARDVSEERRMAMETTRQKEWLRVLLKSIGDGVLAVDLKRRITLINPVAEALTGWPADEALGRDMGEVFRIFSERTGLPAVNPLDRVLAEGVVVGLANHTVLITRDDNVLPIADSGAPIRDCNGTLLGAVMVFRDVTVDREYENELRVSRERYRALYEAVGGGVTVLGSDGRIVDANSFAEEIMGLSRREMIGRASNDHAWSAVREDGFPLPYEETPEMRALHSGKAQRDMVMGLSNKITGKRIWIQVNSVPLLGSDGKVEGVVTTFVDITPRKIIEAELIRRKEFVERILQTAGVVIMVFDLGANIISLNRFGEQLTGYSEQEVRGKSLLTTLIPEEEREKVAGVCNNIRDGDATVCENVILTRDGREVLVRWYSSPLHDVEGRPTAVLAVGHDITELRAVEAQLRQAQKMEAIGQLAGGIAHDFNNLLTGILGNISLALTDAPSGSSQVTVLGEAEGAAKRAAEITAQLLGFSRKAMLQPRPVNINECILETVGILRRTIDPRIKVETCLEQDLWLVKADLAQIIQVLMNLCLNAQDAMPEGGSIIMETSNVTLDEDYVRTNPAHGRTGDFVMIAVSDTGCGMPPEVSERIFEPFFTTKALGRGTGLGLAMVYGIVRQQEGWIECDSEAGKGSRFTVYLPRLTGESREVFIQRSHSEQIMHGSETILVVDDEEMVRNLTQMILARYGYQVLLAEDGPTALEIYRREKGKIGLVLLDLTMPRLSGRDTMAALKKIDPNVIVLLSSGYSLNGLGEDLRAVGAAGFVQKPYRAAEMARAVRQALDERNGFEN